MRSLQRLERWPRAGLTCLPTPIHPLRRLTEDLGGPEIWIKRDDLSGLAGGGNKTRKLEFVVGDALARGADTLVTTGAVQSNHTRQTAAAAARVGLRCVLLHNSWASAPGEEYTRVGNPLLSHLLGAELFVDERPRPAGDNGMLLALAEDLRARGARPYAIPEGASEHPLGGLGYVACAAEVLAQSQSLDIGFDWIVHCTGGSSTQAGLVAGFAGLKAPQRVIGVADDGETEEKRKRVLRLARATSEILGLPSRACEVDVEVIAVDDSPYGIPSPHTLAAIRRFARLEGIIADPVYEGRAISGLIRLVEEERFRRDERVLLLHLGGTPAVHGYADLLWAGGFQQLPPLPDSTQA